MVVNMLGKCLAFVLLVTIAVAEIPSYIKICGRKNPNLDKCVIESVEGLREKLRMGMPELDTPPLEPLKLKGLPLSNTEALQAYATNVKIYGLSNFDAKSVHINLEAKTIDINLVIKKVILKADYDVTAKVVVPLKGKGPIHIETDDIHAEVVMKYKLLKKNGDEYMFFSTMTTKLIMKDYSVHFETVDEGSEATLSTAINAALEGGRQEILQSIRPSLERLISEEVLMVANKICKHFTYNELFPDHE